MNQIFNFLILLQVAFFCVGILAVTATAPVGIAVHDTGVSSTSKQQDVSIYK